MPNAQYNLGVMYATGVGVPKDYVKAVHWYRLAAENGFANAQNNLGHMYFKGEGVKKNDINAYVWIAAAKMNGNKDSGTNIGILEKIMSPEKISQGKNMAKKCIESSYKECGILSD